MEEQLIKKILPHSAEAEQSVIGAMIMDQEAILTASEILTSDDFYNPQFRTLYDAMLALYQEGKPVDLVTLQNRLQEMKGSDALDRIFQMHLLFVQFIAKLFFRSFCNFFCRNRAKYTSVGTGFDREHNFFLLQFFGQFFCFFQSLCFQFIVVLLLQFQIIEVLFGRLNAEVFLKQKVSCEPSFTLTTSPFFPRDFTSSNKITFIVLPPFSISNLHPAAFAAMSGV